MKRIICLPNLTDFREGDSESELAILLFFPLLEADSASELVSLVFLPLEGDFESELAGVFLTLEGDSELAI